MDILILKRTREYHAMEEKQNKIFEYIKDFISKNNFPPTIKQIAEELKCEETEVKSAIERLAAEGKIKFESIRDRIIEIIEVIE